MEEKKDTSYEEDSYGADEENKQPDIEIIDKKAEKIEQEDATTENEDDKKSTEALEEKIVQLQQEKDESYNKLLRIQAEYDNFKKRTQKEKQSERKYKSQDLVNELLPAIDNFERALKVEIGEDASNFVEGMSMVYRQILDALESQGVEEIKSVGEEFDPNVHHAVMQVEDDEHESNIILEEMQKGYMLKDRVIRPAMVKVNK